MRMGRSGHGCYKRKRNERNSQQLGGKADSEQRLWVTSKFLAWPTRKMVMQLTLIERQKAFGEETRDSALGTHGVESA